MAPINTKDDKENEIIEGPCPSCGESDSPVRKRICGFIEEIHGDKVIEICCDDCEYQHLQDI